MSIGLSSSQSAVIGKIMDVAYGYAATTQFHAVFSRSCIKYLNEAVRSTRRDGTPVGRDVYALGKSADRVEADHFEAIRTGCTALEPKCRRSR